MIWFDGRDEAILIVILGSFGSIAHCHETSLN